MAAAESYEFENLTTSRGLIHSFVTTLYQDRQGFLWIGTQGGVSRFDGLHFDNYSVQDLIDSDTILQVFQAPDHTVWVMTPRGFLYFEGQEFHTTPANKTFEAETIKVCLQDDLDRFWVGTRQGLYLMTTRGPAISSAVHELAGHNINVLFEDREGVIWVGTRGGGLAYLPPAEPHSWRFYGPEDGLPHDIVNDVAQDQTGKIWIATHNGVAYLSENRWLVPDFQGDLPNPIIYEVAVDQEGKLWFRASLSGVLVWDGRQLDHFTAQNGLADQMITSMLEDSTGRLWLASTRGLTLREDRQFQILTARDGLSSSHITTIYEDRTGIIWAGTASGFVRIEEPRLETFLHDDPKVLIPPLSQIQSIFVDKANRLWFPSHHGLGSFQGSRFRTFTPQEGLPDPVVHCLTEDSEDQLWVGTPKGPAVFDGSNFQKIENPLLAEKSISQIVSGPDGRIWFLRGDRKVVVRAHATDSHCFIPDFLPLELDVREIRVDPTGVVWFFANDRYVCHRGDETEVLLLDSIAPETEVYDSFIKGDGTLWLGTNHGLIVYRNGKFNVLDRDQGLPGAVVRRVFNGLTGELWLALRSPHPGDAGRDIPVGIASFDGISFTLYDKSDGLGRNDILDLVHFADGSLWFMHEKGVTRFQDQVFSNYGISQGLAGNRARKIVQDGKGNIWIGTSGGLSKYRAGLLTSYSTTDGLLDNHVTDLCLDDENRVWIRTRSGIQRYSENYTRPKIELVGLHTADQELPIAQGMRFSHRENMLIIRYRGISLGSGRDRLRFLYKLKGSGEEWIGPISDTKIPLPLNNLKPGDYQFEVKAINRDLYESAHPLAFTFTIMSPIWLTPWFISMSLAAAAALGFVWYRRRMALNIEKARILNELQAAQQMQMNLMPKQRPQIEGFEICGTCRPAREVGGDYYDYFWMNEDHTEIGITVGDVSGQSMEAAIIAVMTSGLLYGEVPNNHSPAQILTKINTPLYRKTEKNVFNAALFARLTTTPRSLVLANAGQIRPLLVRNRQVRILTVDGIHLPLGALPKLQYQESQIQLQPSDLILFFTDGLTEAMNGDRELFGQDRLICLLANLGPGPAESVLERIMTELDQFTGNLPAHDDITLVAVRVT